MFVKLRCKLIKLLAGKTIKVGIGLTCSNITIDNNDAFTLIENCKTIV